METQQQIIIFLKEKFSENQQIYTELKDYKFKIGKMKRSLGITRFNNKIIEISKFALHLGEKKCLNTLLHEIAHVLAGHKNGHNKIWKRIAIRLGCDGKRCSNSKMNIKHNYELSCIGSCTWTRPYIRKPSLKTLYNKMCKCGSNLELVKITNIGEIIAC